MRVCHHARAAVPPVGERGLSTRPLPARHTSSWSVLGCTQQQQQQQQQQLLLVVLGQPPVQVLPPICRTHVNHQEGASNGLTAGGGGRTIQGAQPRELSDGVLTVAWRAGSRVALKVQAVQLGQAVQDLWAENGRGGWQLLCRGH